MMLSKLTYLVVILLACLFFWLLHHEDTSLKPATLQQWADGFATSQPVYPARAIWQLEHGKTIYYYVTPACCEKDVAVFSPQCGNCADSILLDANGEFVCTPDQATTGIEIGDCPRDLYDDLENVRKTRKWIDRR